MSAKSRDRKRTKKTRTLSAPRFVAVAVGNLANLILITVTGGAVLLGLFAAKMLL